MNTPPHHLIGEILVNLGIVNISQVNEARRRQMAQPYIPLGEHLVTLGYITPAQLVEALSKQEGGFHSGTPFPTSG